MIVFLLPAQAATTEPESIFQCGQEFLRELSVTGGRDYVLSEGFAHAGKEIVSSHAYFFVKELNFKKKKNRCTIEIRAQNISNPTDHVYGKRAFYKFKFQFSRNDPTTLLFEEEGKAPSSCTVSPQFINRLKDCSMAPEIPQAMVCQSQVVQGTQIKTIFRADPRTGVSERQVYKLTLAPPPQSVNASPSTTNPAVATTMPTVTAPKVLKEEDLGVRSVKMKWSTVDKVCQLTVNELNENPDQVLDFVMKLDGKPSSVQPAYFNKMRITLDKDHVADLLDDKKNVQCALSPELLRQASRCAAVTDRAESLQKSKNKKVRKRAKKS